MRIEARSPKTVAGSASWSSGRRECTVEPVKPRCAEAEHPRVLPARAGQQLDEDDRCSQPTDLRCADRATQRLSSAVVAAFGPPRTCVLSCTAANMRDVSLVVDTASAVRRLEPSEFARWAATRTVFLSSEMRELGALRETVSRRLRDAGFAVVMFEDLGGRDEDAERAYLDGVARSDIYVGVVADRYGTMLASGRSPTHEEYLEARRRGKRISVWVARDSSNRQGHATDFVQELQTYHTTGQFTDAEDLAERLLLRLAEVAADDEAPWIKVGDVCLRASVIRDTGSTVSIEAEVRDLAAARSLESSRPDQWNSSPEVPIATAHRAGVGRITEVVSETRAASTRLITLTADVQWGGDRSGAMDVSFNNYSPDDQTELALRSGLLRDSLPADLNDPFGSTIDTRDPLEPLASLGLPTAAEEAIAALLISEYLLGTGRASAIEDFALGPRTVNGQRLTLTYAEPQRYANQPPGTRTVDGTRPV